MEAQVKPAAQKIETPVSSEEEFVDLKEETVEEVAEVAEPAPETPKAKAKKTSKK